MCGWRLNGCGWMPMGVLNIVEWMVEMWMKGGRKQRFLHWTDTVSGLSARANMASLERTWPLVGETRGRTSLARTSLEPAQASELLGGPARTDFPTLERTWTLVGEGRDRSLSARASFLPARTKELLGPSAWADFPSLERTWNLSWGWFSAHCCNDLKRRPSLMPPWHEMMRILNLNPCTLKIWREVGGLFDI